MLGTPILPQFHRHPSDTTTTSTSQRHKTTTMLSGVVGLFVVFTLPCVAPHIYYAAHAHKVGEEIGVFLTLWSLLGVMANSLWLCCRMRANLNDVTGLPSLWSLDHVVDGPGLRYNIAGGMGGAGQDGGRSGLEYTIGLGSVDSVINKNNNSNNNNNNNSHKHNKSFKVIRRGGSVICFDYRCQDNGLPDIHLSSFHNDRCWYWTPFLCTLLLVETILRPGVYHS